MKRIVGLAVAATAVLALVTQAADAAPRKKMKRQHAPAQVVVHPYPDIHHPVFPFAPRLAPPVAAAAVVTGTGATVGFLALNDWSFAGDFGTRRTSGLTTGAAYAATTIGCVAIAPMVATAFAGRELTFREAHTLAADCILPFIGGYLMSKAYDANPHWEPAKPAPRRVVRRASR